VKAPSYESPARVQSNFPQQFSDDFASQKPVGVLKTPAPQSNAASASDICSRVAGGFNPRRTAGAFRSSHFSIRSQINFIIPNRVNRSHRLSEIRLLGLPSITFRVIDTESILAKVRIAMSKVTSKLQVTLPKALADQYGITPGDQVEWIAAGEVIKVLPPSANTPASNPQSRLKLFDQSTIRQQRRQKDRASVSKRAGRGWNREDLYDGRGSR
jgi:bifunctional DNA-binding transcriptional regulator/antitoxin component of YhaV-PrlF toxin-antitoxin module